MTDFGHDSDCAIHNAPAYEAGKCDCSRLGMTGWQPISTAPKDGTMVLLAEIDPDEPETLWDKYGHIDIGCWERSERDPAFTVEGWASNYGRIDDPTHWMPLPAPPDKQPEKVA